MNYRPFMCFPVFVFGSLLFCWPSIFGFVELGDDGPATGVGARFFSMPRFSRSKSSTRSALCWFLSVFFSLFSVCEYFSGFIC